MTAEESDYFFERVRGMTYATISGTLVVSLIQGGLGGLMFLILGLPSPLLWGVAMAVMAMLPGLGTLAIWLPAVVVLAAQGHWTKAMILFGWGALVVSTIDNLLYPMLVGREGRLHTLPVGPGGRTKRALRDLGGRAGALTQWVRGTPEGRRALLASVVVIGLLLAVGGWWLGFGRYTQAPTLTQLTRENAVAEAARLGFTVEFGSGRYDETVPIDTVIVGILDSVQVEGKSVFKRTDG